MLADLTFNYCCSKWTVYGVIFQTNIKHNQHSETSSSSYSIWTHWIAAEYHTLEQASILLNYFPSKQSVAKTNICFISKRYSQLTTWLQGWSEQLSHRYDSKINKSENMWVQIM